MNTHQMAERHGKHAVWIVEAQILLGGKRKPHKIFERLDILRNDIQLIELIPVTIC